MIVLVEVCMKQPKQDIHAQVQSLISAGIIVSDIKEAEDYLSNHVNYYRLSSYLGLCEYNGQSKKYIKGTSFKHLQELSKLDFALRQIILPMTIDIEFSAKLEMNYDCSENSKDDGYSVVSSYLAQDPVLDSKFKSIVQKQQNTKNVSDEYGRGILLGHYPDLSVWHMVELLTMGEFISFWQYYYAAFPKSGLNVTWRNNELFQTKKLRNACAHNNFILPSLTKAPSQANKQLLNNLSKMAQKAGNPFSDSEKKAIRDSILLCDVGMLLVFYDEIVISKHLKEKASANLHKFIDERAIENHTLFDSNPVLVTSYKALKKMIDVIFPLPKTRRCFIQKWIHRD
ncbi:MAG: Abi family protein, partial [Treponema sp.]|nr:Abi family protein [Candidatus Treponema scatequi]